MRLLFQRSFSVIIASSSLLVASPSLATNTQSDLATNLMTSSQPSLDIGSANLSLNPQPIRVSVAPNWVSKLPSVRNRIIGELEGYLKKLAQGNQGSAKIEALRIEGRDLYVKVLIHHKHKPKQQWGVPLGIPYSLQTWIETRYNPLDNRSIGDRTKLCVRGPSVIGSPSLCVTAGEVRRIISSFL
ncbi:hypothetical protein [Pseudanabaena sp. Chao 1811]|jgi:hypothetical protein|uniref:hypothetical protein n=1 Tax=Pseudanabaena sp. Chao 1811 TaxID=2963092 RepID=UPI0022F3912B|nr:hypothetical protein [Pseudanabaena sp. Chao 1811]